MRHVATAIVFLGAGALIVHAQAALPVQTLASGAITVSGRVLADDSGDPLANARVVPSASTIALTDGQTASLSLQLGRWPWSTLVVLTGLVRRHRVSAR